jgi:hypothetical protein
MKGLERSEAQKDDVWAKKKNGDTCPYSVPNNTRKRFSSFSQIVSKILQEKLALRSFRYQKYRMSPSKYSELKAATFFELHF